MPVKTTSFDVPDKLCDYTFLKIYIYILYSYKFFIPSKKEASPEMGDAA
jgi:hypothetical protein